jgi:hypothetical protein
VVFNWFVLCFLRQIEKRVFCVFHREIRRYRLIHSNETDENTRNEYILIPTVWMSTEIESKLFGKQKHIQTHIILLLHCLGNKIVKNWIVFIKIRYSLYLCIIVILFVIGTCLTTRLAIKLIIISQRFVYI